MNEVACGGRMPCESCAVQFSVFRRKRACSECERFYCAACLRRGGGMCAACRTLSTRPLQRPAAALLKVRDLQCFLQRQNVSTRGCVEKEELVSLCVAHVNSAAYRRRGTRAPAGAGASPFTTLKGLTTNINDFINSAFDLRNPQQQSQPQHTGPPTAGGCYNAAHAHTSPPHAAAPPPSRRERFTTTPGGERDIVVPVPGAQGAESHSECSDGARVDTADCFEVEDLDDASWELVARPADPLPNDSEVLMTAPDSALADGGAARAPGSAAGTPRRAASELELHRSESAASAADTASLQDEPLMDDQGEAPRQVSLELVRRASELDALSVKQLKELLARNRVEYRGCLERADLLQRARMLWRDHNKYKDEIDSLPIEECCKICMAAPLECVLLECGHIAACTACAKQLAECPICRQYVVRAVRVFRS